MKHFIKQFESTNTVRDPERKLLSKVPEIMQLKGGAGVQVKIALLGGLSKEQVLMVHQKPICPEIFLFCSCNNLHVIAGPNDLVFISSSESCSNSGPKYFTILPRALWQQSRSTRPSDSDIALAEKILFQIGLLWDDLAAIFLASQSRYDIELFFPECQDRVGIIGSSYNAVFSLLCRYSLGWEQCGLVLKFEC